MQWLSNIEVELFFTTLTKLLRVKSQGQNPTQPTVRGDSGRVLQRGPVHPGPGRQPAQPGGALQEGDEAEEQHLQQSPHW